MRGRVLDTPPVSTAFFHVFLRVKDRGVIYPVGGPYFGRFFSRRGAPIKMIILYHPPPGVPLGWVGGPLSPLV